MSDASLTPIGYRIHANSAIASVHHLSDSGGLFIAMAGLPGHSHNGRTTNSVNAARALADQATGCPQPCTCPPWLAPL